MARKGRDDDVLLVLHELRNPLVGIDAAARVLSRELGAHPGAKRASAIASEAQHLLSMLETVADAEAAAAGRLRTSAKPLDLSALVRECVDMAAPEGRVVTVSGVDEPVTVNADAGRIRQVLTNLLMNAAQYSPAGTPIDVIVRADARRASVEVHDRGPGIPASERRKLFRKFTRLSTANGTRGSGLGLYICKAIVAEHGGGISYKSNAFTFSLPLRKRSARAGDVAGGRPSRTRGSEPSGRRQRTTRTEGSRSSGSRSAPRRTMPHKRLPKRLLAASPARAVRKR